MFQTFVTTVNAVAPIILLIFLGYILKRINFLTPAFLKVGNKFVFKVALPCMLFINIYDSMQSFSDIDWAVVLYVVAIILIVFALGLVTALLVTKDKKRRGVLVQCSFRSNFAVIGLSLVERIGGDTAVAGIVSAFSIPMFNILGVIALSVFTQQSEEDTQLTISDLSETPAKRKKGGEVVAILKKIVTNPLIIGVLTGLLFVGIREIEVAACGVSAEEIPFRFDTQLKFVYTAVNSLKLIASPLALLVMGGQFEFSAVKGMTKEIVCGVVWRIFLSPLIGIGGALLLDVLTPIEFGAEVYPTLVAMFATPVAVASAIMAGEMDNDEQLATQLVVWTSIFSVLSIFVIVFILLSCGIIVV